ncbi:hypothetical protein [Sansalvadorimonas verongulae]|uniref:hypothetical protein n=1 Tax=Sansalvadorimonas verongulae TaxID=2172824 RepID=UPI0012BB7B7D|nr:hypothetical protein [Sansalvadorimonas verongulae]MTI15484.1 hypothetical protein [Sansalvadorimonas verongulae]
MLPAVTHALRSTNQVVQSPETAQPVVAIFKDQWTCVAFEGHIKHMTECVKCGNEYADIARMKLIKDNTIRIAYQCKPQCSLLIPREQLERNIYLPARIIQQQLPAKRSSAHNGENCCDEYPQPKAMKR